MLTTCGYPIAEHDLVERFCGMSDAEMLAIIEREWGRAASFLHRARRRDDRVWVLSITRGNRGSD
jgi:hypothetical protein